MDEQPGGRIISIASHRALDRGVGSVAQQEVAEARRLLDLDPADFVEVLAPLLGWRPSPDVVLGWETGPAAPPGDVVVAARQLAGSASRQWQEWQGRYVSASDARVQDSQDEWCRVRAGLNAHRPHLARLAASLYGPPRQLGDTGLVAGPGWIPPAPVDLAAIQLHHRADAAEPVLCGSEEETAEVRPRAGLLQRYRRYHQAIRDLNHPKLFENRPSWRLVDVDGTNQTLGFGDSTFFAAVDVHEALAHEIAYVALGENGQPRPAASTMRDLPYRRLVGDPADVGRRPAVASIDTVTLRRAGDRAWFLLHRRDPAAVASAGGSLSVIPCGIFQPATVAAAQTGADFDLWRNIEREYAEELLGADEHDGNGDPVRYDLPPFSLMDAARRDGGLSAWWLGVAADALTLFVEVLTAVVFDDATFRRLFGHGIVMANAEGTIAHQAGDVWFPFTKEQIGSLTAGGALTPASAGCLQLAWQHRNTILA